MDNNEERRRSGAFASTTASLSQDSLLALPDELARRLDLVDQVTVLQSSLLCASHAGECSRRRACCSRAWFSQSFDMLFYAVYLVSWPAVGQICRSNRWSANGASRFFHRCKHVAIHSSHARYAIAACIQSVLSLYRFDMTLRGTMMTSLHSCKGLCLNGDKKRGSRPLLLH